MLITVRAYIWGALVYTSKAVQPSSNNQVPNAALDVIYWLGQIIALNELQ